ncbi:MAG: hypothetical protein WC528_03600 [Patescibacteria group bacterium]
MPETVKRTKKKMPLRAFIEETNRRMEKWPAWKRKIHVGIYTLPITPAPQPKRRKNAQRHAR